VNYREHDEPYDSDDEFDSDEEEQSLTIPCPHCGADIYEDSVRCPRCGTYLTPDTNPWSGRPGWWILVGLLGIVALVWAAKSDIAVVAR
jgi:DNA-directed RNA polymerase subunit RPC12/RpoP